ncbi:hypothetical protein CANCADRAFT_109026 [Tortispora caseinolytica NRRL Y-17796]|uniref:CSN8/PSMD8/EIF3K domain-containing protein n=1 Tax=Tortispora caseinolytica NRRL Y-17796 TaxID=767744 RepID=A0A1E4TFX1_9ASCO|nr:hypothetical protein CANCADRAFT_109026 [Tortispora caseinolytica NRRL Y-17796]
MNRPESIQNILKTLDLYNKEKIPELERYCSNTDTYDFTAFTALMKIYQINPELLNIDIVSLLLIKALVFFKESDFILLAHLLPPYVLFEESNDKLSVSTKSLYSSYKALNNAEFTNFWTIIKANDSIKTLDSFESNVRVEILKVIQGTCHSLSKDLLFEYLNISSMDELNAIDPNAELVEGDIVKFHNTVEQEPKLASQTESVKFEDFSKLFAHAAATNS